MFEKARIKLTAWYLLIIMLISLSFSLVIFNVQMAEVDRFARAQKMRIERQFPPADFAPFEPLQIDSDLIDESAKRLLINMVIINGVILVVSGGLGYLLAGKTLRPIKDMIEEQDRFISDSSHELRTPLTSLKSAMEVALMDKGLTLNDAKKTISENIEDVDRLQKLSDSLILLTRKNTKHNLVYENLSIKLVAQSALKQTQSLADKKKIILKQKIKDVSLMGDKDKLTNLLVILLDNAIKYSPEKSSISLKTWKTKQALKIAVRDHGIGISNEDLPHIFDRFYRADTSRSSVKAQGYGLGLSIAKMIVDEHKGRLSVKSVIKEGTTFTISLPLRQS